MGKISQEAVHEAGHVIAAFAHAIQIGSVHVGKIWYSDSNRHGCTNGLIKMGGRADALGHVDRAGTKKEWVDTIISVSGYAAEKLWPRQGLTFKELLTGHQYNNDCPGDLDIDDIEHACARSEELLRSNWKYVVKLARLFNVNKNHTFRESELLEACDIWVDPAKPTSRYTKKFKWSTETWNYVEEGKQPGGCPL